MKHVKLIIGLLMIGLIIGIIGVNFRNKLIQSNQTTDNKKIENATTADNKEKETIKKEIAKEESPKEEIKTEEPKKQVPEPKKIEKGKVVVIDPGHANKSNLEKEQVAPGSSELKIKDGGGAEGRVTKTPEYAINMKVALKLRSALNEKGFTVILTKEEVSKSLGNIERAEIGNKAKAALVIRIHADSSDDNSVRGASMLVPAVINDNTKEIYKESKRCGQIVLNTLINEVGMKNRGVVERNDMTGFNWSTVPVTLIEMGFLSNNEEDALLSTESYQNKIAQALANGIEKALNN